MSQSFIKELKKNLPNISIIFEKFHEMKMMNEVVNEVRRGEQKENAILTKTRLFWLKNRENLKNEERTQLDKLLQMNLKTSRAYRSKLDLQELWKMSDFDAAQEFLKRWLWRATHSRIKQIQDFEWTIKRHWDGILNIVRSSISNGVLEA